MQCASHLFEGRNSDQRNPRKWEFAWDQNARASLETNMALKIFEQEICGHFAIEHALIDD